MQNLKSQKKSIKENIFVILSLYQEKIKTKLKKNYKWFAF